MDQSAVCGATIHRGDVAGSDRELFFYFRPRISYVVYDATIEGGMFSRPSPVTFDVRPWKLYLESGIMGSYKKWTASYSLVFYTKDVMNDMVKNHLYASIHVAFRFGG
jgi:hypothetical protein